LFRRVSVPAASGAAPRAQARQSPDGQSADESSPLPRGNLLPPPGAIPTQRTAGQQPARPAPAAANQPPSWSARPHRGGPLSGTGGHAHAPRLAATPPGRPERRLECGLQRGAALHRSAPAGRRASDDSCCVASGDGAAARRSCEEHSRGHVDESRTEKPQRSHGSLVNTDCDGNLEI
jgi:hypothetical protein